jgi:hypothetical protein
LPCKKNQSKSIGIKYFHKYNHYNADKHKGAYINRNISSPFLYEIHYLDPPATSTILGLAAQRLVAQALGRVRLVDSILAGILKLHSSVFALSLGQVACSHVLGLHLVAGNITNMLTIVNFDFRF